MTVYVFRVPWSSERTRIRLVDLRPGERGYDFEGRLVARMAVEA